MKKSYLRIAKKALNSSPAKGHKVAAICLNSSGKIISVGVNSYIKSHTVQAKFAKMAGKTENQFLHAEVHAIIRARTPIYKILVVRFSKDGQTALAEPCEICKLAIKEAGIKFVEHTV